MSEDEKEFYEQQIADLEARLAQSEERRQAAVGKSAVYLEELKTVRKARERGKRANRKLRGDVDALQARLYRLTNRP